MSRSAQVEFVHEDGRYRAEVEYSRTRHSAGPCRECGHADTTAHVSALIVLIWHAGTPVPPSDERFTELARAAKAAFEASATYQDALADQGPL